MGLLPADFKSAASADFAIRALPCFLFNLLLSMDLSQFLQPGACDLPSVHQMTFLAEDRVRAEIQHRDRDCSTWNIGGGILAMKNNASFFVGSYLVS